MDRLARFEALTSIPEPAAVGLAELVLDRAADGARGELFNLGEVLVTEARVSVDGHEGWGMVLGRAPDHALSVAVVDASLEAGHPRRVEIEQQLLTLAEEAARVSAEEWQRVAPTRVQFDVF
jgi:alpha-D-ribose 1-methylphosphonate 5-triphosphate synthase subunit PhnG